MMLYAYYDRGHTSKETKVGDHFVPDEPLVLSLAESVQHTMDYMRTQFPRRGSYFDSDQVDKYVWDITEIAKAEQKFYPKSRIDDVVRKRVLQNYGTQGREFHTLNFDDAVYAINCMIAESHQPLPVVKLSAWQNKALEYVLTDIVQGKRTIMAELCARFGKTIWAGALVRETDCQLTVIASYVLTSFSSFMKDLRKYHQFRDLVLVDTATEDYQQQIDDAIANGKQVVAFLSMCAGTKRKHKVDYLFGKACTRMLIVDEADYGIHQINQAKLLVDSRDANDVVVLMTGTNADKAVNHWNADSFHSVVYPELIMYKRSGQQHYVSTLQHFLVDAGRHDLVVDMQLYQMDLSRIVNKARSHDPDLFVDDGTYLPSWNKFASDPARAMVLWSNMLEAIFLGKHGTDELNVDYQTRRGAHEGQRVAMMFLPGNITNANLANAAALAKNVLPAFEIVTVCGDDMTNAESEAIVLDRIKQAAQTGNHVLILSARMAQRSFSVGQITELYLAYDAGSEGATIQKISRALTPDQNGKIARIISLSFDSQRDDKFDALLLETALNYKKSHGIDSVKHALDTVIRTVDIFECTPDGAVKFDQDQYLTRCIERNSLSRVVGKTSDISKLSLAEMTAIAQGNTDVFTVDGAVQTDKGKTRLINIKQSHTKALKAGWDEAKLREQVTKVITVIVENMDIIVLGTGTKILKDAFRDISQDALKQQAVLEEFGVGYEIIQHLLDRQVINRDLLELRLDQI